MLFIIDNPNNFQTGLEIHGLHTRSKNQLFIPTANLTSVQKGITYPDINTFTAIVDLSRFNNSCLKSRQRRP